MVLYKLGDSVVQTCCCLFFLITSLIIYITWTVVRFENLEARGGSSTREGILYY